MSSDAVLQLSIDFIAGIISLFVIIAVIVAYAKLIVLGSRFIAEKFKDQYYVCFGAIGFLALALGLGALIVR